MYGAAEAVRTKGAEVRFFLSLSSSVQRLSVSVGLILFSLRRLQQIILEVKKEIVALLFPDRISEGVAEEKSHEGRWERQNRTNQILTVQLHE